VPRNDVGVAANLVNAVTRVVGGADHSEYGDRIAGRVDAEHSTYNEPGVQTAAILYALADRENFETRAQNAHRFVGTAARRAVAEPAADSRQVVRATAPEFGVTDETAVAEVVAAERGGAVTLGDESLSDAEVAGRVAQSDPEAAFDASVVEAYAEAAGESASQDPGARGR
jgi:hypothetical protein